MMKRLILIVLIAIALFASPTVVKALSPSGAYENSVEGSVGRSDAILEIAVLEAYPPKGGTPAEPEVYKAAVTRVLKGDKRLKVIEFRFTPEANVAPAKSASIIGETYLAFFHVFDGRYFWAYSGKKGLRPLVYFETRQFAAEVEQLLKEASSK